MNQSFRIKLHRMSLVYVIRCAGDKFYVGKTNCYHERMTSHFGGRGSQWTKLHKPIEAIYTKQNAGEFDEDMITLKYMARYGIENVRGGSFANPKLFPSQLWVISRMLATATGKSFHCSPTFHFNPDNKKTFPENHYKSWTPEEKGKLNEEVNKGSTIDEIAQILKRTSRAIKMRLEK